MNANVRKISGSKATLCACLTAVLACIFVFAAATPCTPAQAQDSASKTGQVTVNAGDGSATVFSAYQIFAADVTDGMNDKIASNIAWAGDDAENATVAAIKATDAAYAGTTAQDAANWLDNAESNNQDAFNAAVTALAKNLVSSRTAPVSITAGTAVDLAQGYWLVASSDSSVKTGQAGTAPILVTVGGSAATATAKAAVPTVNKQVLEDSSNAWQKQADATVGDSLSWRLEATVPAGITGYHSYKIAFHDTLSTGLAKPSNVRVYVAASPSGNDTAFWANGSEPDNGWSKLDSSAYKTSYSAQSDGASFDVTVTDLVSAMKNAGMDFADGARICVVYDAPLTASAARGTTKGNPNTVTLRYPSSPYSNAYTEAQPQSATAYTWALSLTKRDTETDAALSGAVLRITDDQGRHLTSDGSWTSDDATVTADAKGRIAAAGVDSGTYTVEEVEAPEGYTLASGSHTIELTVTLDPNHIVHSEVQADLKAAAPLRADSFDAATGKVKVSLLNSSIAASGKGGGGIASLLPKTGDRFYGILVALIAIAGAAALLSRKRGRGNSRN